MMFNQYPYLNLNDLNLDYILAQIKTMMNEVTNFVSINAIKYADPIQWDITRQYEKNTVVIDPVTGTAYISVAPVPAGVALTRPEYWTVVFDLGSFVTRAAQNFTSRYEQDTTLTATFPTNTGEWLVWGDVLYKALTNITAGDSYVVDGNIEHFTIEDLYNTYLNTIATILAMVGDLADLTTSDTSSIVNAINSVVSDFDNKIGDLATLNTTDKTSTVNAINEVLDDLDTYVDNTKIANVLDYGAIGDGVNDDTSAINDAIATGKLVYFPRGNYLVSSMAGFALDNFVGVGEIVNNSHNYPVGKAASVNAYENDFATLSDLISWINKSKYEIANVYIDTAAVVIASNDFADFLRAGNILHLYPLNGIESATIHDGEVYIHDPDWKNTTQVAHLTVDNNSICHIVGTETVKAKASNFHYWVMNASLYLTGVSVVVDSNCIFDFFLYAERGAYVQAYSYTWSGTTGTCWGASILENSYCESPVYDWTTYQTFFPTSHSTTPNVNSRDYLLSALAVGGRIGNIPDYGWKPYYGTSDYDLAGKTLFFAEDIPDIYSSLTIYGRDIKCTGNIFVQIRRFFENTYDASVGDYTGDDTQVPATPYTHPVSGTVNVGGVDYPISASCQLSSYLFKLEDFAVSAAPFGVGTGTIEFQLTFIQFAGLSRPQYIGFVVDGAGTKHYIQGFCKAGRIASIRAFTDASFTQGKGNIIMTF